MKICFCGLGSIGKRHLINLLLVAKELEIDLEIHALRMTDNVIGDDINNYIAKQITDKNKLDCDYDVAFITNPTAFHYAAIRNMAGRTKHMFIEKPIFDNSDYPISDLDLNEAGVYYIAEPLRYSGVIKGMKAIISEENIYSVRAICSSYLPDWRPNTDYRLIYSARKALGGGVAIDLIHEWDYITYLFGFPERVFCISGKYSNLEIDSEDIAVYIAEYQDKLVELHLDYFGRIPIRKIEIFTESGTILGDLINNTISFTDGRKPIRFHEEKNDIYLREMRFFIDHVLENQDFNNMNDCYSILNIALGKAEGASARR